MKRWLIMIVGLGALGAGAAWAGAGAFAARGREVPGADVVTEMRDRRAAAISASLATPQATATPAPPRSPAAFSECYGERRADTAGFETRAATPGSIFANCQVVAYYGYPGNPGLGVLGQGEPAAMVARLKAETAAHDAANGGRRAVPALEIIAAIAQTSPQDDRSYLYRIPTDLLEQQLVFAKENDLLVILDLQMGHSTIDLELRRLLPYLADARVQIAVDPEWAMPDGVAPGAEIGGMDASAINRAQELISGWVRDHRLPGRKLLIVHQFTEEMIRAREQLKAYPGVDLLIDMDGFGGQAIKIANYSRFVDEEQAPHGGLKLFYLDDVDLMTPAQVDRLSPQPDLVIYQ